MSIVSQLAYETNLMLNYILYFDNI